MSDLSREARVRVFHSPLWAHALSRVQVSVGGDGTFQFRQGNTVEQTPDSMSDVQSCDAL